MSQPRSALIMSECRLNYSPTINRLIHSPNPATYQSLNNSIVNDTRSSISGQTPHMIVDNEDSITLSNSASCTNSNHQEEEEDEDEESSNEDDENDEEDDDEDYVYEDIDDGDVIEDDEEEEDEGDDDDDDDDEDNDDDDGDDEDNEDDDENDEEHYVDASNQNNTGGRYPGQDDQNVDDDDDNEDIENINQEDDDSTDDNLNSSIHNDNNSLSLDGERMLEVTRKLVRSTERDPDRDLRKQVLLKTAIKKLPHFMGYNRYSESLNHNLHLNGSPNPSINCMSPTQTYYEHHHHHHHHHHNHHHNLLLTQSHPNQEDHLQLDSQPKSFYYSVQPNAIQMSTTGLRMLDLNDDHDSETAITENNLDNTIVCAKQNPNLQGYNNGTSLENTSSHEYEPPLISHQQPDTQSNLYEGYPQQSHDPKKTHPSDFMDHLHDQKDSNVRNYDIGHQESTDQSVVEDNQLDNLYINSSSQINDGSSAIKTDERIPIAFQVACDVCDFNCVPGNCVKKVNSQDSSTDASTISQTAIINDPILSSPHHEFGAQLEEDSEAKDPLLSSPANNDSGISGYGEDLMDEVDAANRNESNASSSSQDSSTDSDDSVNLNHTIPQSFLGTIDTENSLLDNRLNSSSGDHPNPHDSGVSLFSPRSNKRSSSSIGLDDDMEIDNLTELSSAQNTSIGSNISQYKKLRKREIIE